MCLADTLIAWLGSWIIEWLANDRIAGLLYIDPGSVRFFDTTVLFASQGLLPPIYPEDWNSKFLRNGDILLQNHTASQTRRPDMDVHRS
jgi:hypothetical protein